MSIFSACEQLGIDLNLKKDTCKKLMGTCREFFVCKVINMGEN